MEITPHAPILSQQIPNIQPLTKLKSEVSRLLDQQSNQATDFDVVVIGTGSMGSAACYHLAKQGCRVLGIEQFDIPHEFGSHSSQSRIIRKAYFEHANYVPLLQQAYKNWKTIAQESGIALYCQTGLLYLGPKGHQLLDNVRKSAKEYAIPINHYSPAELAEKHPTFKIPSDYACLWGPEAGFLLPEHAILAYTSEALKHRATIKTNERTVDYTQKASYLEIKTTKSTYTCKKLVVTAGAWTGELLPSLNSKLNVTRQIVAWMHPLNPADFVIGKFPCWVMTDPKGQGIYYGFPHLPTPAFEGPAGMKVAHHYPGAVIDLNQLISPVNESEQRDLTDFMKKFIPTGCQSITTTQTCLYTNSPDEHFMLGFAPENDNIVVAAGFSGHGFKFASVIGEIVTDLATKGSTNHPIDFLRPNRWS